MAVDGVSYTKTVDEIINETAAKAKERNTTGELGKNDFLNLLVTQLQYQDPLNPMDDKEFIAQIAQFSSLEQMQNLNTTMTSMKAFSMLGNYVVAQVTDSASGELKLVEGNVTNVKTSSGKTYVVVNGEDIPVENVLEVYPGNGSSGNTSNISSYTNLIGYNVSAYIQGSTPGEKVKVTGLVYEIVGKGESSYAVIDGVNAAVAEIAEGKPSADPDYMESYLEGRIGETVKLVIKDKTTGNKAEVEGKLRGFTVGEDGEITAVLDEVSIPVSGIDRVSPPDMTMEQILLLQILQRLTPSEGNNGESSEGSGTDPVEDTPEV